MKSAEQGPRLWPYLAVALADPDGVAGLGFLADDKTFVTAAHVADRTRALLLAGQPQQSGERAATRVSTAGPLAILRVAGAETGLADLAFTPLRDPTPGEACEVAAVDVAGPSIAILSGLIGDRRGDGFSVVLSSGLDEHRTAGGSPVVVGDGIVGVVGPIATNRSVDAFRVDPLRRALRDAVSLSEASRRSLSDAARFAEATDASGDRVQASPPAAVLTAAMRLAAERKDTTAAYLLAEFLGQQASPPVDPLDAVRRGAQAVGLVLPPGRSSAKTLDDAELSASPVQPILLRAAEYAVRTGSSSQLHRRHLVAAALTDPEQVAVAQVLGAVGVSVDQARRQLRDIIMDMRPSDPAEEWDAILAPSPAFELGGGTSEDLVDPTRFIELNRDHLGVRDYVTMLATVIADEGTPMPLSIGLFGEWGSGKSTFMGLLRGQVDALSSRGPDGVSDIKQIGFNAWHYADTNLWASLGDEIFEQLAGPGADGVSDAARRKELQAALADRLQRRKELESATERAREESARLSSEVDGARAARERSAGALAAAVLRSDTLRKEVSDAAARLGVDDKASVDLLARELRGATNDVAATRQAFAGRRRLLLAAVGILAIVAIAAAIVVTTDLGRWLAAGGLVTLAALAAATVTILARARSGLAILREVGEGVRRNAVTATRPQLLELREAEARQRLLQAQLDQVVERTGELGRELAELAPGQRLYSFVTERAQSDSYRRHLGVISTVRKDFEQLIMLMGEWKSEQHPEQVQGEPARPADPARRPIKRIVLYIDDLDRCSPKQVVDVLQAVHLLLALELFVVVVGVDPRWLLRSLQRQYRSLLSGPTTGIDDPDWMATPEDYLEKIFNIPFALPRMNRESYRELLLSLAETEPPAAGATEPAEPDVPANGASAHETVAVAASAVKSYVEPESPVHAAVTGTTPPEIRPLTGTELALLSSLAPLVPTPREAKRLLNLYRMLRSTANLSDAATFLGDDRQPGEYQAVAVLLGLLTAHGRLMEHVLAFPPDRPDVMGGLLHRDTQTGWSSFVGDIAPKRTNTGWTNGIVGEIKPTDVERWKVLGDGLAGPTRLVTLPDISVFQLWAPRIARFSFLLSPSMPHSDSEPRRDESQTA